MGSPADSAEGVQRYAEKLETILRDEGSALDELEPPEEMAATHRDLVEQIDKQADSLRAIAAAAAETTGRRRRRRRSWASRRRVGSSRRPRRSG